VKFWLQTIRHDDAVHGYMLPKTLKDNYRRSSLKKSQTIR